MCSNTGVGLKFECPARSILIRLLHHLADDGSEAGNLPSHKEAGAIVCHGHMQSLHISLRCRFYEVVMGGCGNTYIHACDHRRLMPTVKWYWRIRKSPESWSANRAGGVHDGNASAAAAYQGCAEQVQE